MKNSFVSFNFIKLSKSEISGKIRLSSSPRKIKIKIELKSKIKCSDTYIIYSIQCKVCSKQYVGQTSNTAAKRFNSHFYDVVHYLNKPVARHFNSRNHCVSDMILTPFEKLYVKDKTMLNVRERYWILEKETAIHGLNINV